MVLTGDRHPSVDQPAHRVIATVMTKGELEGARSQGESENLMAEAESKGRNMTDQLSRGRNRLGGGFGIAGSAAQKDPVGVAAQDVGGRGRSGHHVGLANAAGKLAEGV